MVHDGRVVIANIYQEQSYLSAVNVALSKKKKSYKKKNRCCFVTTVRQLSDSMDRCPELHLFFY